MAEINAELETAENQDVLVNNMLIRAKKRSNLLESKIEVLAIKKLQSEPLTMTETDPQGVEYTYDKVVLTSAELKILMGRSSGSFYEDIRTAADRMMQRYIVMEEPKAHQFVFRHYYHEVRYSNGKFSIAFENGMQPYLKNLSANYTKLSMPILWSFSTNGAFQLYLHLRSYIYKITEKPQSIKSQKEAEYIIKEYSVPELRANLGYIDLDDDDKIQREAKKPHPDWEKIDNLEKKPKYKRWSDFYTRVIKPGIKEINEKSDIYIAKTQTVKCGRGGKITGVKFYIQYNKAFFEKGGSTSDMRLVDGKENVLEKYSPIPMETVTEILSIFPEDEKLITPVEAEIFYNDAKGDINAIKDAYECAKKAGHISNFIGFMRKAIKEDYAGRNVEVIDGSRKKADNVNEARHMMENTDEASMLAQYWKKAEEKNTEIFQKFISFLSEKNITKEMFEAVNTPEECGNKFMRWIKNEPIDLM